MTDVEGSRAVQSVLWGAAAQERDALLASFIRPLWVAMLDATGVAKGTRFLDAGCGSGGASVIATERGADVTGLDAAEQMIAVARERVPSGKFHVGDLQTPPFADGTFEAIVACNSVHFTAKPLVTLRSLRRICSPAGKIAVACLGDPKECQTSELLTTVRAVFDKPHPDTWPFTLSEPGVLDGLVREAGLTQLDGVKVDCDMVYADVDTAWRAHRSIGPVQAAMRDSDEATIKKVLWAKLETYVGAGGKVYLKNKFRYVLARP